MTSPTTWNRRGREPMARRSFATIEQQTPESTLVLVENQGVLTSAAALEARSRFETKRRLPSSSLIVDAAFHGAEFIVDGRSFAVNMHGLLRNRN